MWTTSGRASPHRSLAAPPPREKRRGLRLFPIRPTETTLGLGASTRSVEVAAKRGDKKVLLVGDERSLIDLEITCVCIGVCVCTSFLSNVFLM